MKVFGIQSKTLLALLRVQNIITKKHSGQLQALDALRKEYAGTPYEQQVNDRYNTHLNRLQLDKGEVVDKNGEPIKVLPPDQWKGGK